MELLRNRVRDHLAWEEVANIPEAEGLDDTRETLLKGFRVQARGNVPDALVQAYNTVVTVSAKGDVEALRVTTGEEPVFETIKKDKRCRIQ